MLPPHPLDPTTAKIGLIVVGYESASHADRLLASLPAGVVPFAPTLILIDNGGTARAFTDAAREWPHDLVLHECDENLGFTGGTERGLRLLADRGEWDYVVLLNPDTEVRPGWLSALLAPFEDPSVGTTGSVLFLPSGRVDARGCGIHYLGFGFTLGYGREPGAVLPEATYTSGAAMAISRQALEKVQALSGDEGIFWRDLYLYHDDLDLGWRMRLAGLGVRIAEGSTVVHDHAFDGRAGNERKFAYMERNRWLVLLANYRGPTLVVLFPFLLLAEIALAFRGRRVGVGRFRVYRDVWRALGPAFWKRRRRIQERRVRSDRELLAALHGRLDHPEMGGGGAWINAASAAGYRVVSALVRW